MSDLISRRATKLENKAKKAAWDYYHAVKDLGRLHGATGGFDAKMVFPEFTIEIHLHKPKGDGEDNTPLLVT